MMTKVKIYQIIITHHKILEDITTGKITQILYQEYIQWVAMPTGVSNLLHVEKVY